MELPDFDGPDEPDDELDPLLDELRESDSVDARVIRQIAIEDILAKVILCLYRLEELYQEDVRAGEILNVLPIMAMDSAVGEVQGTAYTYVFDRVRYLIDLYQGQPPDEE